LERFEYLFKYIHYKNLNNTNLIVKILLKDIEANLIANIIQSNKLTNIKESFSSINLSYSNELIRF
jgi:hypothetical protein